MLAEELCSHVASPHPSALSLSPELGWETRGAILAPGPRRWEQAGLCSAPSCCPRPHYTPGSRVLLFFFLCLTVCCSSPLFFSPPSLPPMGTAWLHPSCL